MVDTFLIQHLFTWSHNFINIVKIDDLQRQHPFGRELITHNLHKQLTSMKSTGHAPSLRLGHETKCWIMILILTSMKECFRDINNLVIIFNMFDYIDIVISNIIPDEHHRMCCRSLITNLRSMIMNIRYVFNTVSLKIPRYNNAKRFFKIAWIDVRREYTLVAARGRSRNKIGWEEENLGSFFVFQLVTQVLYIYHKM